MEIGITLNNKLVSNKVITKRSLINNTLLTSLLVVIVIMSLSANIDGTKAFKAIDIITKL